MSDILGDIYLNYKKWICKNPQKVGDYETLVKWISYIIAGRINNSILLSEVVYSLSNLLVLFNDRIIVAGNNRAVFEKQDNIKIYLTVVEYCEVFLELSAQKLWGTTGKWIIIFLIQIFKCICKLMLIHQYKEPITQSPAITPLDRMSTDFNLKTESTVADLAYAQRNTVSFSLKRSGKVVRKIESAPTSRNWKPIDQSLSEQTIEHALAGQQLIAETLYIVKPMLHLCATSCFGYNTWKPWLISFCADIVSLHLYNSCRRTKENCLSRKQGIQLSKRYFSLLLYLLKSPFYERYTKEKLNGTLESVGNKLPLANFLTSPLQKYIPFWQNNYFYMWSS